jgi:hypothetical protein
MESPQLDLIRRVTKAFDDAGVPYMLTGSTVSSLQGEPRSTQDLDVVADLTEERLAAFLAHFPEPDYYRDEAVARRALRSRRMFNIIDGANGLKVDVYPIGPTEFDRAKFDRRAEVRYSGLVLRVSSPEDTIIQKLVWAKKIGTSERQVRDALGVYEVQLHRLDQEYLDRWAARTGVEDLLRQVRERAVRR